MSERDEIPPNLPSYEIGAGHVLQKVFREKLRNKIQKTIDFKTNNLFKSDSQEFFGKIKIGESANLFREKLRSQGTTNPFTPSYGISRLKEPESSVKIKHSDVSRSLAVKDIKKLIFVGDSLSTATLSDEQRAMI